MDEALLLIIYNISFLNSVLLTDKPCYKFIFNSSKITSENLRKF